MKLKSISIYMLSLAGMLGLWSCSTDEAISEGGLVASGEKVPVTITISRGAQTRTELSENTTNGGLNQVWSEGDVVKLYNSNGAEAGTLTLQSGANTPDGIFKGNVEGETGTYRLWYFGKPQADAENPYPYLDFSTTKGQVKLDLQNQNFRSLDELEAVDILSTDVNIVVKNEQGTVGQAVTMAPHVAMARFTISGIPEGTSGTVNIYNNLNSDRGGIYAKQPLLLSTGVQQGDNTTTTSFTYDEVKNGDDIYVAFIPNAYTLHFEFEASNGAKYTHTFGQNSIKAGVYYRSFNKEDKAETGTIEGVEVPMEIVGSPINMGNWGLADLDPISEETTPTWVTDDNMWIVNCWNSIHTGGYGTAITFKRNGFKNGVLTSTVQSAVMDQAMYYQWGRWLGYPFDAYRTDWSDNSDYFFIPNKNQYLYGLNVNDTRLGYMGDDRLAPAYGAHPMGANSNFTVQRAKDWSIMYALTSSYAWTSSGDYVYNNEDCSWEDRSGNPCPDNYRLPTETELQYLIPSKVQIINGQHAEVKEYAGTKYAMKWIVDSNTDFPYVEIISFKTANDNVSVGDSNFDKSEQRVRLYAYGFLDSKIERYRNVGGYNNKPKVGLYWSSTSSSNIDSSVKTLIDLTYNPFSGKGGKALQLEFGNSGLTMKINSIPRNFGCLVLPFYDESKKSSTLTPMIPLRIYHENCPYF